MAPLAPEAVDKVAAGDAAELRLLPAEVYLKTYVQLFGAGSPAEVQKRARTGEGPRLFDNWNDYAAALGLPDRRNDLPRATESNALMMATFDRLAIALCVRGAEHDLRGDRPVGERTLFAFGGLPEPQTRAAFVAPFDVLHRSFLSYPAALAPAARTDTYFALFRETLARHKSATAPKRPVLNPLESAWTAVCIALAVHPEAHSY